MDKKLVVEVYEIFTDRINNELGKKYNTKIKLTNNKNEITISYKIDECMGVITEMDKEINSYMESCGFECVGSGSGFGYRDNHYR